MRSKLINLSSEVTMSRLEDKSVSVFRKLWNKFLYFLNEIFWWNTWLWKYSRFHIHNASLLMNFSCFFTESLFHEEYLGIWRTNSKVQLHTQLKEEFLDEKLIGINILKYKRTLLKKINASFIVHFRLSQYNFSPSTFELISYSL